MEEPHMVVPELPKNQAPHQFKPATPLEPAFSGQSSSSIIPPEKKPRKILYIILGAIAVVVIVVLAALFIIVGLGKTALGQSMQDTLWQNTIETANENIADYDISMTYTDKGDFKVVPSEFMKPFDMGMTAEDFAQYDKQYTFTISNFTASTQMASYFNLADTEKPKLDLHIAGNVSNNKKEFTADGDVRLKDTEAFARYNYNSNVEDLLNYIMGGDEASRAQKNQWVRLTNEQSLKELREAISAQGNDLPPDFKKKQAKYKMLLKDNRLFNIKLMRGLSMVNKTPVIHYELTLDKEKLRTVVMGVVDDTFKGGADQELKNFAGEVVDAWLEKINVDDYQIWIGVTDHKVYKSTISLNALSLVESLAYLKEIVNDPKSPFAESLGSSRSQSRDAKRLADMRQMASAVELYYDIKGEYPPAEKGKPIGLTPDIIAILPETVLPVDGKCDDFHNTYWYKRPTPTTYTYAFCLGDNTGGLPAGNQILSQAGIQSENPTPPYSPATDDYSSQQGDKAFESFKSAIINTIKNLNFNANITINFEARSYGTEREIESPPNYVDENYQNI